MPGKAGMKGEGLGGFRPNAGRKAKWFKAEREQTFVMERETIGGIIQNPELWRVLSVSEDEIEFQCGDDIIVIRVPE